MKWKINNKDKAHKFGIRILKAGPDRFLMVDLYNIPKEMSIEEFISFLQRTGIAICADHNNYKKKKK